MSDARKFLTIPSQEALFAEEGCSSAADDEGDDEEVEDAARLMPRSSPVPRKRGLSILDEAEEYLKTRLAMATRRVSFADTSGGELVEVKEFVAFESDEEGDSTLEQRETPHDGGSDDDDGGGGGGQVAYEVRADFEVPGLPALLAAVRANKVEVERVSFPEDEPLAFTGLVRVLNISFHKAVYVRFTMDGWSSFFDLRADYVQGSNDVETDQFSFKLSFAKPYLYSGARIEFVVRFETPEGDHWANNAGRNYSLSLSLTQQQQQDSTQATEAATEKRRGILKAPSYRMETNYEETPSVETEQEDTRKAEVNVRPESAVVCPQIIYPEIDIENIDAVTSSRPTPSSDVEAAEGMTSLAAESLQEEMRSISLAKKNRDVTELRTMQPLTTQHQEEPHQAPNLRKETEVPPDAIPEHSNVASIPEISCLCSVTPCTGSVESYTSSIFFSVPVSSFQGMDFVTQATDTKKVPLEQHEPLPPSLDVVEPYRESQTPDMDIVTEERDEMSTMIQSQHVTSFSDLNISETDLLHAANSSVHIRQDNESKNRDAQINESTSVHEMQAAFTCLPEELGKQNNRDKHSTTGEKLKAAETSKNVENTQVVGEELLGKLDALVTASGKDASVCQSQDSQVSMLESSPALPSFPKGDPTFVMDEPTAIYSEGPLSTRQLAEMTNVTSCAHEEQRRLYDTPETTQSPDVAASILPSAAAAVSITTSTSDIPVQSLNILEACEATFSHNNEPTDVASLIVDSLQKEEVSFEQQQPPQPDTALVASQRDECETAVVRALVTALVTCAFAVCLVMVIINPSIFLIIGLYHLL